MVKFSRALKFGILTKEHELGCEEVFPLGPMLAPHSGCAGRVRTNIGVKI